jgi:hypothetical protein
MSTDNYDGKGLLRVNSKAADNDKAPILKGVVNINGQKYYLAAWFNDKGMEQLNEDDEADLRALLTDVASMDEPPIIFSLKVDEPLAQAQEGGNTRRSSNRGSRRSAQQGATTDDNW